MLQHKKYSIVANNDTNVAKHGPDFQRFLNQILRGLTFVYNYIDNLLMHRNINVIFRWYLNASMIMGFSLTHQNVNWVYIYKFWTSNRQPGHIHVYPLLDKVQAVKGFPQPTTACKLQEFLRLVTFITAFFLAQHTPYSHSTSC